MTKTWREAPAPRTLAHLGQLGRAALSSPRRSPASHPLHKGTAMPAPPSRFPPQDSILAQGPICRRGRTESTRPECSLARGTGLSSRQVLPHANSQGKRLLPLASLSPAGGPFRK